MDFVSTEGGFVDPKMCQEGRTQTSENQRDANLDGADKLVSIGRLSPFANAAMSDHVVGGNILLPGVGYIEMAFAYCKAQQLALTAVAFVRPCVLPELSAGRQSGILLEIASQRGSSQSCMSSFGSFSELAIG